MTGLLFALVATVIVVAGAQLARYGDVIGEKSGLGRSWIGVVLLAATTSVPELFTGFGIVLGVVFMNALFLIGLTEQVLTKRFRVAWDTGAVAVVYAGAVWLVYVMRS